MEQAVSEFQKAFIARTKQARKNARLTQKQMGHAIGGIPQDIYKNYETIRELPHEYIPTFCLVCEVTADWLFDVERRIGEREIPTQTRRGRPKTPEVVADPPLAVSVKGR